MVSTVDRGAAAVKPRASIQMSHVQRETPLVLAVESVPADVGRKVCGIGLPGMGMQLEVRG